MARLHEGAHGSPGDGLADEVVRVEPHAAQRHEEVAGVQRSRVRDDAAYLPIRITGSDAPADRIGEPSQRHAEPVHPTRDLRRRASSASRATATSSNGRTRPSIS